MIHAICDFCGKDCDRCATLLTMTPICNFARYHKDTKPYGEDIPSKSFVICHDCKKKHGLPNPIHTLLLHLMENGMKRVKWVGGDIALKLQKKRKNGVKHSTIRLSKMPILT
jgi:hypothetical protein